jgi:hypothetical protein
MRLPGGRFAGLWITAVVVVMAVFLLTVAQKYAGEEAQRQFHVKLTRIIDEEIVEVRTNRTDSVTIYAPFQLERVAAQPDCVSRIHDVRIPSWTDLTDQRWSLLKRLPHLESLGVYDSGSAESLFERIEGTESLHRVNLTSMPFSDEGMRQIARLPELRELVIRAVPGVSNKGLTYMRGHSALERLSLTNTNIDGQGLAVLSEIPRLHSLVLDDDRPVGSLSEGLEHLKRLHRLRSLVLGGKWGSEATVEELRRALPNCTVRIGQEDVNR